MSTGRASGAPSRTRTPLEQEPDLEPEPEPNHRYRVGQVVWTGGTQRGGVVREYRQGRGLQRPGSGRRGGGADADSSAILEPTAGEFRPISLCSVLGRDGSAGQAGKGNALGVWEAGSGSWKRACAAAFWHPCPGPAPVTRTAPWLGRGVGPDLRGLLVLGPEDRFPIPPPVPSYSPLTPEGALARARPPGPHVGTTA